MEVGYGLAVSADSSHLALLHTSDSGTKDGNANHRIGIFFIFSIDYVKFFP